MKKFIKQRVVRIEHDTIVTCDVCRKPIQKVDVFDGNEVTVQALIGSVYPECDSREVMELDCCVPCFVNQVRPLLERELGVKFRDREVFETGPSSSKILEKTSLPD